MMIKTYNQRKVDRTEVNGFKIDTVEVFDREWRYETGILHQKFKGGKDWVIVEGYSTKDEAVTGHNKWVEIATNEEIVSLTDVFEEETFYRR